VYVGVAGWGITGAAWGHVLASVLLTCAFLVAVHGRTVPARLVDLMRHAYLPGVFGVGAVAVAADAGKYLFGTGPFGLTLLVLATAMLLFAWGVLFVIE
jgi:hypothetical protein